MHSHGTIKRPQVERVYILIENVHRYNAAAHLVARPKPRAQNARERSSMQQVTRARGCCAAASASGDDLEPANRGWHVLSIPGAPKLAQKLAKFAPY